MKDADKTAGPLGLGLGEGLGPLPEPLDWPDGEYTAQDMRAERERCYALGVAAERERLLALAKKRADYEASAAAHHAGRWHVAHEHHLARHAAMRDLIDALEGPNVRGQPEPR